VIFAGAASTVSAEPETPNILFIYTDDQSFRTVSCYPGAYNFADTPNIDRLAEQGIRFDQAYIGAKCVPSRAGMLTGRYQYACAEGPEYKWWTTALRTKGYYTGMIGKWHWGKGAEAHQHGVAWDWSVVWDHGQYDAAGGYYYDQKVMINGGEPEDLEGYSTDRYTDYTVEFIKERGEEPDKPWFHWLAYGAVHGPYTPADRHKGTLDDKPAPEVPDDIYGPRPDKPVHRQGSRWKTNEDGEPIFKGKTLEFWAKQQTEAVAAIDDGVGRIMKALEETGQLENTIVVFTSDQGYVWGHHGLKGKIWPYAAAIRCPLIVMYPKGYPQGTVCKTPVNGMDLIRTFHSIAEAEPDQVLHGRDMTPLLEKPESKEVAAEWNKTPTMMTYTRNTYTAERMVEKLSINSWSSFIIGGKDDKKKLNTPNPGDGWDPCYFMTIDGEYKYIRYIFPNRIEELYDINADPDELTNLSMKPEHKDRVAKMRGDLIEYLKNTGGASFVDLLPPPKTDLTAPKPVQAEGNTGKNIPDTETAFYVEGKNRVHVVGCRRLTTDPKELAALTQMTVGQAKAKGLPPCSRCVTDYAAQKAPKAEAEPPSDEVTVYYNEGKKRVHVLGCKRLPTAPDELATFKKMTPAEAKVKGLPLCSRCPGSTTSGRAKD
jgi:arylsulfatase A-like enzyme